MTRPMTRPMTGTMTRQELEAWLGGDRSALSTAGEIAEVLGVTLDAIGDPSPLRAARRLAGARFTVAVLRDVFGDDRGVRRWMRAPRPELDGLAPLDLLWAGEVPAIETLAMREWHWALVAVARADHGADGGPDAAQADAA